MNKMIAWPAICALALSIGACGGSDDNAAPAAGAAGDSTSAKPAAASLFDFAAWVAANADCKGEYFSDVQEPDFAHTLRDAGVLVSAESSIGEVGPGGGTLTPGRPIRLHGLPVRRVDYDFGSGSTFAVVVDANPEQARAAIDAKPLADIYREYYSLGVATAPPSEDVPMPDIQFVRAGEQKGTQEIGCAAFDM
ncbi:MULTISPECIES: hypothetical protein [unclassified Lysobacter]|uniref:hypothetical protein n=1 Tax=unclassified Lysobacter TaxID=2635362 RepID=UPI001BECEB20|nr:MULTISPECIES: hypothetical protein [unclassified Lysobacter]MBT2746645.1 hypothetical protein [Lysobacter sp. ISL-42]MBT2753360.1 hypothetical protein [Lysobacter sp. ISL-50]MBT2775470.1 hypothetical protein [Lysobacter sp. ISL-54]MBT2782994.1 hypothetical protein [Lysobacter sp. ISL-52]